MSQVDYLSGSYEAPWVNVGSITLQTPPALNPAPTVTLTDTTQGSGSYYAGDSFTLTATGPTNPANLPVSVSVNGIDDGVVGNIQPNGSFTVSGSWTTANVGSYTEIWYVDGVQAGAALRFNVDPQPTPDPAPLPYPNALANPPAPPTPACNVAGTWSDTSDEPYPFTWRLNQPDNTINGSMTDSDPIDGSATWSVSGTIASGVLTLTASNPIPATGLTGMVWANPITATVTLSQVLKRLRIGGRHWSGGRRERAALEVLPRLLVRPRN